MAVTNADGEERRRKAVRHHDDPLVAAMTDALRPYPWQRLRPELLARSLLAAKDRHELSCALTRLPGTAVGPWEELRPVDRDDARLAALIHFLVSHRWTELSLASLCWHVLVVLDGFS